MALRVTAACLLALPCLLPRDASCQETEAAGTEEVRLYIAEYRVRGATTIEPVEIEKAVYPYMGPGRSVEDVESARQALEKAFHDKGFQTVLVQVPEQDGRGGIIHLEVVERPVGRLRVRNSRWFLPSRIKEGAPSMGEGRIANFNDVQREVVSLNQWPDRQVIPELKEGGAPDTVDIDLVVKDIFPLHGSLELNNRQSPDTTPLRLNGYFAYTNLLQLGHTIGANFQISPEDTEEVSVFSAYYIVRIPEVDWLTVMLMGTIQDSNISTLGGSAVAGPGTTLGISFIFALPPKDGFYHSLRFGIDYKDLDQELEFGGELSSTPIDYVPMTFDYNATWVGDTRETSLNAAVVWGMRGAGSSPQEFDARRYAANGSFIYLRGSLAHTEDLPHGFQATGSLKGQAADSPLVDSEQFAGGGLGTARGYLESEALGDNALFGSIELASPSLLGALGDGFSLRLHTFIEGGTLWIREALPEQTDSNDLASYGFGARMLLFDFLNGSLDVASPLKTVGTSNQGDWRLTFRLWGDF